MTDATFSQPCTGRVLLLAAGFCLCACAPSAPDRIAAPAADKPTTFGPPAVQQVGQEAPVPPVKTAPAEDGKLSQCSRDLDALKAFNQANYNKYQRELGKLTRTSTQYLAVSSGISSEINDRVRPRYQYALSSLCYRIRNDLSVALIQQVNTHD